MEARKTISDKLTFKADPQDHDEAQRGGQWSLKSADFSSFHDWETLGRFNDRVDRSSKQTSGSHINNDMLMLPKHN